MKRRYHKEPKLQLKYQVQQEYYREDGTWITDQYPVVYDTEAEAEACKKRIAGASPREFGGWMQPDACLSVTTCYCA